MKIGIIGAGQIGGTSPAASPHSGTRSSSPTHADPKRLADLTAETGANAVSVREAARGVDLVIVTIPEKNIPSLPPDLFAGVQDERGRRRYRQLLPAAARRPDRRRSRRG